MIAFLFTFLSANAVFESVPSQICTRPLETEARGAFKSVSPIQLRENLKRILTSVENRDLIFEVRDFKYEVIGYVISKPRLRWLRKKNSQELRVEHKRHLQFKILLSNSEWLNKPENSVIQVGYAPSIAFIKPNIFNIDQLKMRPRSVELKEFIPNFFFYAYDVSRFAQPLIITTDGNESFILNFLEPHVKDVEKTYSVFNIQQNLDILVATVKNRIRFRVLKVGHFELTRL